MISGLSLVSLWTVAVVSGLSLDGCGGLLSLSGQWRWFLVSLWSLFGRAVVSLVSLSLDGGVGVSGLSLDGCGGVSCLSLEDGVTGCNTTKKKENQIILEGDEGSRRLTWLFILNTFEYDLALYY